MSQIEAVKYLRRTEASAYLRAQWGLSYSPSTLAKLACGGDAPTHHRCGRVVLYAPTDLDQWAAARIETAVPKKVAHVKRSLHPHALAEMAGAP
jgi:hypothetical protein